MGNSRWKRSGCDQQTAFGEATVVGVPFYRGEFGLWNQAVLFLFGAGVLFSLVPGWVMYFKRRGTGRAGPAPLLPLPGAWRPASPLALASALAQCALMPLLALSASAPLAIEWLPCSSRGQPDA